ncbi:MAG TPA: cysteine desulfurase-like protein [Actinomycetota bacterium]
MAPSDLSSVRTRFPALARRGPDGRPFVFADAPGGTQVPDAVIEAIAGHLRSGVSNTHGAFVTSRETDALIDEAHRAGADLLGVAPDEVVFGANATSLLLHLSRSFARTIGPGDEVVVTRLDHDANVRPWVLAARDAGATVRWVDLRDDDVTLDVASFASALGDRTALVAFTLASNAVGTITPAAELARRAKEAGALVAVDGVHLAQHHAIDLAAIGADLVATSPYKFFGPHLGMLGVRRELLEAWTPYKLRPATDEDPGRWETGTQSHEALAGTVAAIGYLAEVGRAHGSPADGSRRAAIVAAFDAIAAHERDLARRFLDGAATIDGLRLFGIADASRLDERTPTFAVRLGDRHPLRISSTLGDRGIFTWDGHYYAIELFDRLGLLDAGGAVRIGFCHYHAVDEVDRVLEALDDVAAGR